MIGLQRGIVKLLPYNEQWAKLFKQEKENLEKVLGEKALGIEHIGSTAIPGIVAKPVIDIALGIDDMKNSEQIKEILGNNSWIWRPGFGDGESHLIFAKGNDQERTHYLHLMQYKGKDWNDRVMFRDYLLSHEPERKQYEELKQKAMSEFENDRKLYTAQKDKFVEEILEKASK